MLNSQAPRPKSNQGKNYNLCCFRYVLFNMFGVVLTHDRATKLRASLGLSCVCVCVCVWEREREREREREIPKTNKNKTTGGREIGV